MLRYPFAVWHPHNKFGYVMQFVFKDFPAYYRIKPTIFKTFLFPLLLVYTICRKTSFERMSAGLQIFLLLFLSVWWWLGVWMYNNQRSYTWLIEQECQQYVATCQFLSPYVANYTSFDAWLFTPSVKTWSNIITWQLVDFESLFDEPIITWNVFSWNNATWGLFSWNVATWNTLTWLVQPNTTTGTTTIWTVFTWALEWPTQNIQKKLLEAKVKVLEQLLQDPNNIYLKQRLSQINEILDQ